MYITHGLMKPRQQTKERTELTQIPTRPTLYYVAFLAIVARLLSGNTLDFVRVMEYPKDNTCLPKFSAGGRARLQVAESSILSSDLK